MIPRTLKSKQFPVRQLAYVKNDAREMLRQIPVEAPIAIEVCGICYAVMMATPSDLRDFAMGFILAEGLISHPNEVDDIAIHRTDGGWLLRIALPAHKAKKAFERARQRVSESSCGLCGIANIEHVLRPLPSITARIATDRQSIARALSALEERQPLGTATRAVHAAAFCAPDGRILCVREDVGRHNALDKLIGALAAKAIAPSVGFILLSARCSYELVEKTARAGCPMLVTISAPTSLAIERAIDAGLTLVALARPDSALVVCDPLGHIG